MYSPPTVASVCVQTVPAPLRYTHVSDNLSHVVMGSKEGGEVAAIQQLAHR